VCSSRLSRSFSWFNIRAGNPYIDNILISGPYDVTGLAETPSRHRIFVCRPTRAAEEDACARKILSTLARRAYRRPATDKDVQTLLKGYKAGRSDGDFEAGVQAALERILAGPEFLFRIERDLPGVGGPAIAPIKKAAAGGVPKWAGRWADAKADVAPDTAYRVSDLELASRLSFFLWSSIPDDELLNLAERGRLNDPAIFEQQVRRMLSDRRSRSLVTNFARSGSTCAISVRRHPTRSCFLNSMKTSVRRSRRRRSFFWRARSARIRAY